MNCLLHICCAPCGIYPFKELTRDAGNKLAGFYFNPNIHPYAEYLNRRGAVEAYAQTTGLAVIYPEYEPSDFFRSIAYNEQKPMRCRHCWRLRLEKTALYARENGFDAFSTTLLISPYQDHLVVKTIGEELAKKFDLEFYYQDFRMGFRASQAEARSFNLYRQKYCGCKYSEEEIVNPKSEYRNPKQCSNSQN